MFRQTLHKTKKEEEKEEYRSMSGCYKSLKKKKTLCMDIINSLYICTLWFCFCA